MSFRLYILRLLLPPFLALGVIYLGILLLFERRDIYAAAQERLRDHTHIVAAYLEAQQPEDFASAEAYLAARLAQNGAYLQEHVPAIRIALVGPEAAEAAFTWPTYFPASYQAPQNSGSTPAHPGYDFFEGEFWYDFPAEAVGTLPISLAHESEPLQLQVRAPNPKLVYFARTFWEPIGVIFVSLTILGVLLSEILTRLLNPNLRRLHQELEAWQSEEPDEASFPTQSRVQEVNDLMSAAETLHETLQAAHAGYGNLLDDAALARDDLEQTHAQNLTIADTLQTALFSLQVLRSYANSPQRLDFLLPTANEHSAYAVSACLRKEASQHERTAILDFLQHNLPSILVAQEPQTSSIETPPWLPQLFRDFHCQVFIPAENQTETFTLKTEGASAAGELVRSMGKFDQLPALSHWVQGAPLPAAWLSQLDAASDDQREILLRNFPLLFKDSGESALFVFKKL